MLEQNKFIKPIKRGFYAFDSLRAGDFLIFIEEQEHHYDFIYIPGGDFFHLTFDEFNTCVKNKILTLVETLPENIFEETLSFALSSKQHLVYDMADEKTQQFISENRSLN